MDIVVTTLVVQLPQETTKVVNTNKIADVQSVLEILAQFNSQQTIATYLQHYVLILP